MTILRVGTNDKYSAGWESIFGGKPTKKSSDKTSGTKATKLEKSQPAKKATAPKKAVKETVSKKSKKEETVATKAAKKTAKKVAKKKR